jgi:catalase
LEGPSPQLGKNPHRQDKKPPTWGYTAQSQTIELRSLRASGMACDLHRVRRLHTDKDETEMQIKPGSQAMKHNLKQFPISATIALCAIGTCGCETQSQQSAASQHVRAAIVKANMEEAAAASAAMEPNVNVQIVDALNKRYGVHPEFRSNHAKGIVVEGNFAPTLQGAELSRSPIFAGTNLPVTVRFSDASGLPDLHDAAPVANPHGMSIKFHLPDGTESDIVLNSLKFFTVATPEDFRDLQLAGATSPPGAPKSPQFEAFLKSHPSVEKANATLGTPASFAEEQYFGIDAFIFTNKNGQKQPFRYIIAPQKIVHLSKEEAAKEPPNYLMDELPQRLAKGPVTFHIKAQLAAPGDQTKDPTQAWPDDRKVVDLGTLTIDKTVADSDAIQKKLLFTPGRLTDGIEPSDDPLIAARDGSYTVSFEQRSPGLANTKFKREAMEREKRDQAQTRQK